MTELTKDELWQALAAEAQSGDKRAYASLLHDISPFIKSVIANSLSNQDWVDDITQDVLISVHKSLNSYSPDRPFKPWLKAIIQFRRTDLLRKHYKDKRTKESAQENTDIFSQNVTFQATSGELKDIEKALDTLPDKQKTIFRMMKIEGYSAKEVASKMDMSVSAVKVTAHRTTNKLKDILNDE